MKVAIVILALLFIKCSSPSPEKIDTPIPVDSIILKSQSGIQQAIETNYKSDSITKEVVYKKVQEMGYLQNLLKVYEQKLNTVKTTEIQTIYKVDTVYIETKKNFWGKEKVSVIQKEGHANSVDSVAADTLNQK